jgi:hypothetical protein
MHHVPAFLMHREIVLPVPMWLRRATTTNPALPDMRGQLGAENNASPLTAGHNAISRPPRNGKKCEQINVPTVIYARNF